MATSKTVNKFPYTIFSNINSKETRFNNSITIYGDVYTNDDIYLRNSSINIIGVVESTKTVYNQQGAMTEGEVSNAPPQEFPYIDIEQFRNQATQYYNSSILLNSKITLGENEILFIDGNIDIKSRLEGSGKIIATGHISFIGTDITFGTENDSISFMAGRDITFTGSDSTLSGMFYTHTGEINFSLSNSLLKGRLYCNKFELRGSKNIIDPGNISGPETQSDNLIYLLVE